MKKPFLELAEGPISKNSRGDKKNSLSNKKAAPSNCFCMSCIYHIPMLPAAIPVIALLIGMSGPAACANETGVQSGFEEHRVEFHNQDVKLAGSLLLPRSEVPVPAVVFVHGAGRQTREPYREAGEYFASQGIAALIYDKRGIGQSGGAYESREPYENLVNDALAAVAFLKQRREIAPSQIGIWGLSQGAYISAAAASRSEDIQFIIAVGASVADGTMFYYRDNLFRKYGLSDTLRDVAEKAQLGQDSLPHNLPDGFRSLFICAEILSPARRIRASRVEPRRPAGLGDVGTTGSTPTGRRERCGFEEFAGPGEQ